MWCYIIVCYVILLQNGGRPRGPGRAGPKTKKERPFSRCRVIQRCHGSLYITTTRCTYILWLLLVTTICNVLYVPHIVLPHLGGVFAPRFIGWSNNHFDNLTCSNTRGIWMSIPIWSCWDVGCWNDSKTRTWNVDPAQSERRKTGLRAAGCSSQRGCLYVLLCVDDA